MELGKKNSLELLNTNRDLFGYIPERLTQYEVDKIKNKVLLKRYRTFKDAQDDKVRKEIIDDLFIGLVVDEISGCWYIQDHKDRYQQIIIKKKRIIAHRLAYEVCIGPIILPLICHHCDRPGCRNPWHLFNGTHDDNMKDATLKGRRYKHKVLTDGERFLLWKHINHPQPKNDKYETFKINDE